MLKLNSLKALLTQCLPDLARDPKRLIVLAENGTVVSTGTTSLSFEWRYTARVIVLDYDGHEDAVIVPIIAWMKRNQSEQMDNPERWGNAIKFRVEPLTPTTMDFGIELQLTERAIVKPDPTAPPDAPHRLVVEHPEEPCHIGTVCKPEHWELWLRDERMLAAWDLTPPPAKAWFSP